MGALLLKINYWSEDSTKLITGWTIKYLKNKFLPHGTIKIGL